MKYSSYLIIFLLNTAFLSLAACKSQSKPTTRKTDTIAMAPCPRFNAKRAFQDIQTQCAFGPRVPGTTAWDKCSAWIMEEFKQAGCQVELQATSVKTWDAKQVPCRNIIARINPQNTDRILLCAHWDSRPWADNDPREEKHKTPVIAANDGASGVSVLLELARHLCKDSTNIKTGIDLICFDVEDMGTPQWAQGNDDSQETWCLGSAYWATKAIESGYKARFGILLDMVGGRGATFAIEGISRHYAEPLVQLLWRTARELGYGHYFINKDGGYVTDDHLNINRIAGIPTIDIIPHHEDGPSSFGPTWHTVDDTPENIDPNTLEAVGQSILQLIYNDAKN